MGGRGSSSGIANSGGGKTSSVINGGGKTLPVTNSGGRTLPKISGGILPPMPIMEGDPLLKKALATKTKYTKEQINKMSRKKLESIAEAISIKEGVKDGIHPMEAALRSTLLMASQTTPQLRKYIKKYG